MTSRKLLRVALIALALALLSGLFLLAVSQARFENVRLRAVTDGDTVRLDMELAPRLWAIDERCRLLRMDAPEMDTPEGPKAKAALGSFLKGKRLVAEIRARDRFGRFLVELWADNENVSDWMVRRGYARKR